MSGRYAVVYRPEVAAEDLPRVPQNLRARIIRAVETRLMTEPARYGERLRRSLIGLWKIRVGDYRVCSEIEGHAVTVWAIRHRHDICSSLERRRLHKEAEAPYGGGAGWDEVGTADERSDELFLHGAISRP